MIELLPENIIEAQARYKQFVDAKRKVRIFWNWRYRVLKNSTLDNHGKTLKKHLKLRSKYFGPFEVIQKVWSIAYKLAYLEGSKIHPVSHVHC